MFEHLFARRVLGGLVALSGALLASYLNFPLPWLLGPMLCVACFRLASAPVSSYKPFRSMGQWVIGVSLGLYFTTEILGLFAQYWFAIAVGMLVPILISIVGTVVLRYVGNADLKTAWFSSAIGGASEMSTLAERYNARVDLVASAHCLRILAVVIVVPFGYQAWNVAGGDVTWLTQRAVNWGQFPILLATTIFAGFIFKRYRVPTSWVLGPLLAAAAVSMFGLVDTSLPGVVVNVGQLLIGWSLGDNYRPAFFKAAPRFLLGIAAFSTSAMAIAALAGFFISVMTDIPLATVWLGLAPGGLAEMTITAKVLGLGVPVVTAFQVSRLVFVVMITGWIYKKYLSPLETSGK